MRSLTAALGILCCSLGTLTHAASAIDALAQVRDACGGRQWQQVRQIDFEGTLTVGDLKGHIERIESVIDARRMTHFDLQTIEGSSGFDGTALWQASAAGLVDVDETEASRHRALTEGFISRRAYLDPQVDVLHPTVRREKSFDVVSITPRDGDPAELWIDTRSHLIARIVLPASQDSTRWSDYRRVDGLLLPHRIESTDAAGNTELIAVNAYTVRTSLDENRLRRPATHLVDTQFSAQRGTLPATVEAGHVFIDVSLNDAPPAPYILDTGSSVNVLTPVTAAALHIEPQGGINANGVGEQQVTAAPASVSKLQVGAVTQRDQTFWILPLPPLTVHRHNHEEQVAGVLGYDFFRRLRVTVNYDDATVSLQPLQSCAAHLSPTINMYLDQQRIPLVALGIDGVEALWNVDLGDAGSLTMSPGVAQRIGVPADAGIRTIRDGGVGGVSHERLLRFNELALGNLRLSGPVVAVSEQSSGAFADPKFGGNLGYGTLRNFIPTFDYECRRLELPPSRTFGAAAPVDGLGVSWHQAGDGHWQALHVMANSPAAAAGLQTRDELLALNGVSGTSLTRDYLNQTQQQPPGAQISIRLRRGGSNHDLKVTLAAFIPTFQRTATIAGPSTQR